MLNVAVAFTGRDAVMLNQKSLCTMEPTGWSLVLLCGCSGGVPVSDGKFERFLFCGFRHASLQKPYFPSTDMFTSQRLQGLERKGLVGIIVLLAWRAVLVLVWCLCVVCVI